MQSIFNKNELNILISALKNPFQIEIEDEKIKAYFLILNTSISKKQLAKKDSYHSIELRPKYIKELALPVLSDSDILFYSNFYDYLYILSNCDVRLNKYVENTHIFNTLLNDIDFLYLEMLYTDEMHSKNTGGLFFREYFDENISFDNLHKEMELPAEYGYIKKISSFPITEKLTLITNLYNKRREPYDAVRNYKLLTPIRAGSLCETIKFYEYKYTSFKK